MNAPKLDAPKLIREHLEQSARVKESVARECAGDIELAAQLIAGSFRKGGKMLLCGNGGSAADCQHFAAEFVSRLTRDFERPALPALALTTDTSFLTAYANDIDFEGVFSRQVEALGKPGDILLGISTSGNSPNVVRAAKRALELGLQVVVLCGQSGVLPSLATAAVRIPSNSTQFIQESHLAVEHILCALVERDLYPEKIK